MTMKPFSMKFKIFVAAILAVAGGGSMPLSADDLFAETAALADASASTSSAAPLAAPSPQSQPVLPDEGAPTAEQAAGDAPVLFRTGDLPGPGVTASSQTNSVGITEPTPSPASADVSPVASHAAESSGTPAASSPSTATSPDAVKEPAHAVDARPAKAAALSTLPSGVPGEGSSKALAPLPVDAPPNLDEPAEKMAETAPAPVAPSENVTLNLINRLVQRGILTKEDAGDLIRQAQEDARHAAQQSQIAQQAATQAAAAQQMAVEAAAPPASDEAVSVSYVPEIVKAEMRDEIRRDVMAAAQAEGWNQSNVPEWLSKFRPFMDLRTRYQGNNYSTNNGTDIFETMNFNEINTQWPINLMAIPGSSPLYNYFGYYQAQAPIGPPTYNTIQQRDQARVRFRFGADMNLGENFTSGFRIGTGQNGSPVSENQTFGFIGNNGMAQGGNFSSYAIWLDRAFLKYEIGSDPDRMAAISIGRFDNPFFTPTTIMWANDIGFDGVAAQARYKIFKGFTPFATAGIFPIFNTDLNFPARQETKQPSNDKYLYAGQVGIDWKITRDLNFKSAAGYYFFQNVEGRVSAPGVTPNQEAQMSTDDSRPGFAQRGNTYSMLRNIQKVDAFDQNGIPTGNTQANYINDPTQGVNPYYINQFQYFGLSTPFNILSANARLEYRHWEPFIVSVSGEWDRNLAWNSQNVLNSGPLPGPDNNYNQTLVSGPVNNINSSGNYNGGNTAWIVQAKIGSGALQKRWDWDFGVSYRYVESDAVIDGFCDSDFGGGGTNLKGYAVGGNLALSRNVFIGARWLSATGIAGPTYQADIIQIDINARF